jgi:predicted AlkP superfamily pyrophosphatase or phosphodiesterase
MAAASALVLAVTAAMAQQDRPAAKPKKVLIIGIDGCRFDALRAARTPHLDRLIREGALDGASQILGRRYQGNDTVSGPGWSSILTGVWADKHGVDDNKFSTPNYREFPHFFARLKQVRPEARTVSLVTWEPIHSQIVTAADVAETYPSSNVGEYRLGDIRVAREAALLLATDDPAAMFLYFGQVDETGHLHGFHPSVPQYVEAIERVDSLIGSVLEALAGRGPTEEDWLILVVTDHGGKGTEHGKGHREPEITNGFLIVHGGGVQPGSIRETTYLVDVAATALAHLGVPLDAAWKLDGRPLERRKEEGGRRNKKLQVPRSKI